MMNTRKTLFVLMIVALFTVGAFILARSSNLTAEMVTNPRVVSAFAPAGVSVSSAAASNIGSAQDAINPIYVNLAEVKPVDVDTQYEQWLRGEIDLENEFRASEFEVAELRAEAMGLEANGNIQLARSGADAKAPVPAGVAFDSMDTSECCGGSGALVPPDPDMAAGPEHLIAVVNVAFEIYNKNGLSLAGPITFESFFTPLEACTDLFDPTVVYDEEADRYAMGIDADGLFFCIAVTATSDPLGGWWLYAIPASWTGEFHDYPHIGVGEDYIYVGSNQFGGGIPGGFEGRVWALHKSTMYAGGALTPVTFSTGLAGGTPQPLHLHGFLQGTWPSTGKHYFVTDPYDGCTMDLWEWVMPAAPVITQTLDLCAATGVPSGFPVEVPQSGGSNIEANDWRFRGLEYRNGHAWTTDTVGCNPGGGTVDCVRWVEVDLTTSPPSLVQAGVYASRRKFRTFPDLVVNHCNDMAIGFTKSWPRIFPGIWFTGRLAGAPVRTLQAEQELKAGEATYVSFDGAPLRWGDYTGMTIDPDGVTFWYLGEYAKAGVPAVANWGTYIGNSSFTGCGGAPRPTKFTALLLGSNEVPPVVTSARGRAMFSFDPTQSRMRYRLRMKNITPTAAHIHCAPAGSNGAVGVTLVGPQGSFRRADQGNSCGWKTLDDVVAAMIGGTAYVNVHSSAFPPGEIRGQVVPR